MRNSEYKNRKMRAIAMQAIIDQLNIQNFTVKDVPRKIKSLRTTYYLEMLKIRRSKNEVGPDYKPSILWLEDMAYIMKSGYGDSPEKETNSDWEDENERGHFLSKNVTSNRLDEDTIELPDPELLLYQSPKRRKRNSQQPQNQRSQTLRRRFGATKKAERDLIDINNILPTPGDEECEIMAKSIALQLRELPVQDRLRANIDIQKILLEYRLKHIIDTSQLKTLDQQSKSSLNSSSSDYNIVVCVQPEFYSEQSDNVDGKTALPSEEGH